MIRRNAYTREVNWSDTMLDAGPWIAVVSLMWAGILLAVWRVARGK